MSSVNYSLKNKGIRLISAEKAWVRGKNGKSKLNPQYHFVGKIDTKLPNFVITARVDKKPAYKGGINDLNNTAKKQTVNRFLNDNGKRNSRTKACYVIKKK